MYKIILCALILLSQNVFANDLLEFNDFVIESDKNISNLNLSHENNKMNRKFYNYKLKKISDLYVTYQTIVIENNLTELNLVIKNNNNTALITKEIFEKGYTTEQLVEFYILKNNSIEFKKNIKKNENITFNFIILKIKD
jgi:hypothetical protein